MVEDPEALTQLARLLGDSRLRQASAVQVLAAIDVRFSQLVDGLIREAAASDDVHDRESALLYIDKRLDFFRPLLREEQLARIRYAANERTAAW